MHSGKESPFTLLPLSLVPSRLLESDCRRRRQLRITSWRLPPPPAQAASQILQPTSNIIDDFSSSITIINSIFSVNTLIRVNVYHWYAPSSGWGCALDHSGWRLAAPPLASISAPSTDLKRIKMAHSLFSLRDFGVDETSTTCWSGCRLVTELKF